MPAGPLTCVRLYELPRELCARPDSELRVDVRQVAGDGSLAEEQGRRDLAVGPALGHECRDALLGGAQTRPGANARRSSRQLGARRGGPARCAESLRIPRARPRGPRAMSASGARGVGSPRGRARPWPGRTGRRRLGGGVTASSSMPIAVEMSPRAAAIRPRQRTAWARTAVAAEPPGGRLPVTCEVRGFVDAAELQ